MLVIIFFFQTFSRLVNLPVRLKVTKIAASLDGRHFLALTSTGEVYSWGDNDHGCLGVKQMEEGYVLIIDWGSRTFKPKARSGPDYNPIHPSCLREECIHFKAIGIFCQHLALAWVVHSDFGPTQKGW